MKDLSPAEIKRGLNIHAMVFVPAIIVLAVVNWLTGPPPWAAYVFVAWGIGLLAHWYFTRPGK